MAKLKSLITYWEQIKFDCCLMKVCKAHWTRVEFNLQVFSLKLLEELAAIQATLGLRERPFSSLVEPSSLARLYHSPPSQSVWTSLWVFIFFVLHKLHDSPGCSCLSRLLAVQISSSTSVFLLGPGLTLLKAAVSQCASPQLLYISEFALTLFLSLEILISFCVPLKN